MRQISHDPIARFTTCKRVSRKAKPSQFWSGTGTYVAGYAAEDPGCAECGTYDRTGRVHRFSNHPDDKPGAPDFSRGEFCSVTCWRTYNA